MRITDQMLFNSGTKSLMRNTEAVAKAQDRASAGKKVLRPSDDPISSTQILKYNKSIAQVDQFTRNMRGSEDFFAVSDSALSGMQEGIRRASELAVEMINASHAPSDRKIVAVEIKQIFEQLSASTNSVDGKGQHIFAGNKISTKPFDFEKPWQGEFVGTTIEGPIEIVKYDPENSEDDSNDRLNVTVDGVNVDVKLEEGFYSGEALATEIQRQVNESLALSDTTPASVVTVQFEPDEEGSEKGHLVITSDAVKGRSSVVFNKVVQPIPEPNAPTKPPLGDARLKLGLVGGKSQLSGEEYVGDNGEMQVLIEPGVPLARNIPGNRVFKGGPDGVDIFASLINFQTALETSNIVGIQTAITDMEKATDQISNERAIIGARLNRLEETKARLENFKLATIEFKSKEEGSDDASQVEAFSELIQQQTALQASLLVQARILQQPTLLSFLR